MITQCKSKKYNYWTRLMVLPLLTTVFCAFVLHAQETKSITMLNDHQNPVLQPLQKRITVLLDAGHGGKDPGARNDQGLMEKDLALQIALEIKKQSSVYNINIVMTREEDIYPALKDRSEMAKTYKADLIVSIHVAAAENSQSAETNAKNQTGFEIFVTNRNQETVEKSRHLGNEIIQHLSNIYSVGNIKQRKESGIWILDAATCPAVLIECGYITNAKDVAFITQTNNQVAIAKSILEGIVSYKNAVNKSSVAYHKSTF